MSELTVTILMPCLNEAETLAFCVRQAVAALRDNNIAGEVVVADNGSTDGSQKIAPTKAPASSRPRPRLRRRPHGRHRSRPRQVRPHGRRRRQLRLRPPPPLPPKLEEGYDLVMGNRFSGEIKPGAMPPLHKYLGNPVLSFIGRLFFRIPVRDFHCGIRAMRRDAILGLNLRTTGMEFASEMVVKSSLAGLRMPRSPPPSPPTAAAAPRTSAPGATAGVTSASFSSSAPAGSSSIPGIITFFVGLIISLWLLPGPQTIGRWTFDVDTLTYSLGLVLIGAHISVFAVSARVFGTQEGFLPPNPSSNASSTTSISKSA
jgi:glycosyltransferase involved in cell wall biosynthesis